MVGVYLSNVGHSGWVCVMDELDAALCRAHEIFLGDLSDATDSELSGVLPMLVRAGYVEESDVDGLPVWGFTQRGVRRGEELGCL
jgi:hypothetical protein